MIEEAEMKVGLLNKCSEPKSKTGGIGAANKNRNELIVLEGLHIAHIKQNLCL